MNFDLRLQSASSRLLLGAGSLLAFTVFAFHIENIFFADFLDKIPLFGTEFAVVSQPLDPQYQFRLGVHWLVANQPELAVPHLERATSLDPYDGRAWAQLASAYQQVGNSELASKAIDRCLLVDPTTPELLWEAANLNVVLGERVKGMDALRKFVDASPNRVPVAAQLAWRATRDARFILDRVLPQNANSDLALLMSLTRIVDPDASARIKIFDDDPANYFVHNLVVMAGSGNSSKSSAAAFDLGAAKQKARLEMRALIERKTGRDFGKTQRELEIARKQESEEAFRTSQDKKQKALSENQDAYTAAAIVWLRLMAQAQAFDTRLGFPYLQALIDSDQDQAALAAWELMGKREAKLRQWSSPGNLIKNASFENEILNGGFDWQYFPSDDYALGVDHSSSKDGSSSLLVRWENSRASSAGVVQYVPVQPDTEYEFAGYMRTSSIQTASGPRFVVQDVDAKEPYFEGPDIRRNVNWTLAQGQFRTRSTAHFVTVRVLRDPNTLIKGNTWIDALSLSPVRPHFPEEH